MTTRAKKTDLELARARLANAEQKLSTLERANSGNVNDTERLAIPILQARAEVARATVEYKLTEHEARVADPQANALRAWLRAAVVAARDAFAGITVPPAPPSLSAYSVEAVAQHAAATIAHVEATEAIPKQYAAVRLRVHAALDSVHKARALLVAERAKTGGITPRSFVPAPPLGTQIAQAYLVPQSAAECSTLLEAIDAPAPLPDVGRYRVEAETAITEAEQIETERLEAERREARRDALTEAESRFEQNFGPGTATPAGAPPEVIDAMRDLRAQHPEIR